MATPPLLLAISAQNKGTQSLSGIKLVEVGNEGGTRNFPPRYQIVHSLLKSKFPDNLLHQ